MEEILAWSFKGTGVEEEKFSLIGHVMRVRRGLQPKMGEHDRAPGDPADGVRRTNSNEKEMLPGKKVFGHGKFGKAGTMGQRPRQSARVF